MVALLLFSVGGLALTSTAGLISKQLRVDAVRERAGRVAFARLESLRASCRIATSGRETVSGIESSWSVSPGGVSQVTLVSRVSYQTWTGGRTDSYGALVPCP
jgi:hypothetical protein